MQLLIASANPAKVREFRDMLTDHPFDFTDLSRLPPVPPPSETGRTFRANACLKAIYYARKLNRWALADDSGLEVDALSGAPGVNSARWAELNHAGRGDTANNDLLLRQLSNVPDSLRSARFVCALALADPDARIILTILDSVDGRIIHAPRGNHGFGYDPLFFIDHLQRTTAELSPEHKHRISHRGRALRRFRALLDAHFRL